MAIRGLEVRVLLDQLVECLSRAGRIIRLELRVREPIAIRDLPFEFAMNGFRLVEGFAAATYEARTGLEATTLEETFASLAARGLVENTAGNWRATPRGFRFLNDILVELLPAPQ